MRCSATSISHGRYPDSKLPFESFTPQSLTDSADLPQMEVTHFDCDGPSLPSLPEDILILVLDYLEAWDVIRCQMVSRAWRLAFSNSDFLKHVLKKYPRAREMRRLTATETETNWAAIFSPIAARYYHMSQGCAKNIIKHKLQPLEQYGYWFPVGQWDYHESQPGGRLYHENAATHLTRLGNKPYLFRATLWSYDDGLLACAVSKTVGNVEDHRHVLSVVDIDGGEQYPVPFSISGKIIRNIALRNHALVVEWAVKEPYHDLNDNEKVHLHFATCYDVRPLRKGWHVVFRNEWKMHFLGLPLNSRDRFFSTHNGTHYAVYFWQPNRSMYTGDEDMPIEALFVWDISTPCPYLPSTDPAGKLLPSENKRPRRLARFSFRELDFIGVRQHANIALMSLHLDSESYSLTIKENTHHDVTGYFDPAERLMHPITTTFVFHGEGPTLLREWYGDLPPYRGHCSMDSAEIENMERWFVPIMDVHDADAHVRFSLVETCFTGQTMLNKIVLRVKSLDQWCTVDDAIVKEVACMGRIAGDERWVIGQNGQMEIVVVKF